MSGYAHVQYGSIASFVVGRLLPVFPWETEIVRAGRHVQKVPERTHTVQQIRHLRSPRREPL